MSRLCSRGHRVRGIILVGFACLLALAWRCDSNRPAMNTVEHDGHTWVVPTYGKSRTPAHHPDCPCGRCDNTDGLECAECDEATAAKVNSGKTQPSATWDATKRMFVLE